MKNKKGYSILEMVLALAIVSGVAYAVLSYYRSEKKDRAIRENAQQIETIFKASDSYLVGLKADGSNQDRNKISMQILKNMNALPINLGAFTKQAILVDTLPVMQTPDPETNESLNQPEEPETVPETPSMPETPIVDNVSFPDEWLKSDPVVVVDNPAPVEPTPETPVETTPQPNTPVEPTEPVDDDTTTGAVINPVVITASDMKGFLISYTWISGLTLDPEYAGEALIQFGSQYDFSNTGIMAGFLVGGNIVNQQLLKSYNNSYNSKASLPVLISSSASDDLVLMKIVFVMAVGYYQGSYPFAAIPSSIEEAVSIILHMTSSQGTIRWYNTGNATTSNVMSKFRYVN